MWKAVKLTNRNVRRVKRDNPAKQSGVMHVKPVTLTAKKFGVTLVKSAMQINLKSHAKIVLTKERLAKNVKTK